MRCRTHAADRSDGHAEAHGEIGRVALERRHRRLGEVERGHDDGGLKDGAARGDVDGDVANVDAQQTGQIGAELHLKGAGEVGGIACDGEGGRDDEHG